MVKKRGQVSLYLVLGVVLIVIVVLMIAIGEGDRRGAEPGTSKDDIDNRPVQNFIINCLKETTDEAIKLAGERGGYIYTDELKQSFYPTEANSVEFTPGSGIFLPYWYYMKSPNTCMGACEFSSMRKPLCKDKESCLLGSDSVSAKDSIQSDIERYIQENIKSCMDFSDFEDMGYDIETSDFTIGTFIRDNNIVSVLNMKTSVELNGDLVEYDRFTSESVSYLAEFYDIATQISNYQSENCFLDAQLINLIHNYKGVDKERLPPIFETSTKYVFWMKSEVKEDLKSLSSAYIPQIRALGLSGESFPQVEGGNDFTQVISDQFTFNMIDGYYDVGIIFSYFPWWEPYFEILPSKGEIILPSNTDDFSKNLINQFFAALDNQYEYGYSYMYSIPVSVSLVKLDPAGKEHVFRFALESNIRDNKCFYPQAAITYVGGIDSLLCDEDFFTEEEYTIRVRDDVTQKPIAGAEVKFVGGDECLLGETGEDGNLISKMPTAVGGFLSAEKEGYLGSYLHESEFSDSPLIRLKPLKQLSIKVLTFNSSVMKRPSGASYFGIRDESLKPIQSGSEKVIGSIERVMDDYKDFEHSDFIYFDPTDTDAEKSTIALAPGRYKINLQLIHEDEENPVVIEEELDRICMATIGGTCIKTPVSPSCFPRGSSDNETLDFYESNCYKEGYTCESAYEAMKKESNFLSDAERILCSIPTGIGTAKCAIKDCRDGFDEEIKYDKVIMETLINGGAVINGTNGYYEFILDEEKDMITFYVMKQKLPSRHHELSNMNDYMELSMDKPYLIMPQLMSSRG